MDYEPLGAQRFASTGGTTVDAGGTLGTSPGNVGTRGLAFAGNDAAFAFSGGTASSSVTSSGSSSMTAVGSGGVTSAGNSSGEPSGRAGVTSSSGAGGDAATPGGNAATGGIAAAAGSPTSGSIAATDGGSTGSSTTAGTAGEVASNGGSSGSSTAGTAGGTALGNPDLSDGYWLMDGTDSAGLIWKDCTLTFNRSTPNGDGTVALAGGIDWFETAAGFGIMFGGEELDAGSFDPVTGRLSFDQTGGWTSADLEHYEATYDAATDTLVRGTWSATVTGSFTARRVLSGRQLAKPAVATTSQSTSAHAAASMVDDDMTTYWATPNGKAIGEVITLTLATPSRIRGMRLLTWQNGGQNGNAARITIVSRDSVGNAVDASDRFIPTDAIWQPVALRIDTLVAEMQITITETNPPAASRISLNEIELFGLP